MRMQVMPSSAKRRAMAAPMPPEAPVMTAYLRTRGGEGGGRDSEGVGLMDFKRLQRV